MCWKALEILHVLQLLNETSFPDEIDSCPFLNCSNNNKPDLWWSPSRWCSMGHGFSFSVMFEVCWFFKGCKMPGIGPSAKFIEEWVYSMAACCWINRATPCTGLLVRFHSCWRDLTSKGCNFSADSSRHVHVSSYPSLSFQKRGNQSRKLWPTMTTMPVKAQLLHLHTGYKPNGASWLVLTQHASSWVQFQ
jgi:hypothetical protein